MPAVRKGGDDVALKTKNYDKQLTWQTEIYNIKKTEEPNEVQLWMIIKWNQMKLAAKKHKAAQKKI